MLSSLHSFVALPGPGRGPREQTKLYHQSGNIKGGGLCRGGGVGVLISDIRRRREERREGGGREGGRCQTAVDGMMLLLLFCLL